MSTPGSGAGAEAAPQEVGAPLAEVLRHTRSRLVEAGVASPHADAHSLLAFVLEIDTGELQRRAVLGRRFPADLAPRFAALLDRRCAREPLQHLTGTAPFRRLDLAVGPGVFVPRPETETVADLAIAACAGIDRPVVVDLCTGSGALALAIADEVPGSRVHAVETSSEALPWARRNIAGTGLPVTLHDDDVTGDLPTVAPLRGTVDVVVSNPPYIPPGAIPVDAEVARHDPPRALYGGGDDGLEIPRAVAHAAAPLLRPGGVLVMEHADVQSDALVAHLRAGEAWTDVTAHTDLTDRPRAVRARRTDASGRAS
ncbi:peptide chain release factor N(5)-glutamine methyltransferase [Mobilicoccus pelagius]|uniref:Release factor glutamine methyltransferase n=1 Tax=Mobilicoccus pelagius NBRC 104925 TaxID=1089455 RepID=H5UMT1_9MICO|nr:peptide chain release factor N(5)-glutamine methyltransferase [Mobilicoccus pelagius]GAB47039.1 protein methyltransferase HemK [Mobilicoccus pelagius NBRC 104925]